MHNIDTGDILNINPKALEMFGYGKEDINQVDLENGVVEIDPYTPTNVQRLIKEAAQGKPRVFEWLAKHKNRRRRVRRYNTGRNSSDIEKMVQRFYGAVKSCNEPESEITSEYFLRLRREQIRSLILSFSTRS